MEEIEDAGKSFHYWHWWTTSTVFTLLPFSVNAGFPALVWINLVRIVRGTAAVSDCCQDSVLLFFSLFILVLIGNKTAGTYVHVSLPIYFIAAANNRIFLTTPPVSRSWFQGRVPTWTRQLFLDFKASIYRKNIDLNKILLQKDCWAKLDLFKYGPLSFT